MCEIEQFKEVILKESPIPYDFKVGDIVTFTNEFGVEFKDKEVIGFAIDDSFYGRFIYINTDCFWFQKRPSQLSKSIPLEE